MWLTTLTSPTTDCVGVPQASKPSLSAIPQSPPSQLNSIQSASRSVSERIFSGCFYRSFAGKRRWFTHVSGVAGQGMVGTRPGRQDSCPPFLVPPAPLVARLSQGSLYYARTRRCTVHVQKQVRASFVPPPPHPVPPFVRTCLKRWLIRPVMTAHY